MLTVLKAATLVCVGLTFATAASSQILTPAEEGRRLFLAYNCYGCHGDVGAGSAYGAPALRNGEAELGDLTEAIREGEDSGMPRFPDLNNGPAIAAIYAYLQTLGGPSEPTFFQWWERVPIASLQPRVLRRRHVTASLRVVKAAAPK